MYPGTDWLLVLNKNRSDPIVIMDFEAFYKLLKRINTLEREADFNGRH
jgi:hypothetical protein